MTATIAKEKPIELNDEEVSRLLTMREVMLYVPMDPQPESTGQNGGRLREIVPSLLLNRGDLFDVRYELDNPRAIRCPFGAPGDRLYVKEVAKLAGSSGFGGKTNKIELEYEVRDQHGSLVKCFARDDSGVYGRGWWVAARRMPKWASRFTLEVASVDVSQIAVEWLWALSLRRLEAS